MNIPKYAARSDANQTVIADDLRKLMYSVQSTNKVGEDFPDLVVGILFYKGTKAIRTNILLEVKTPGSKLSKGQVDFFREWKGAKAVVRSTDQALEVIDEYKMSLKLL